MHRSLFFLSILLTTYSYSQSVQELSEEKNFHELVKFEKQADKLTPEELSMVGFAFFRLENDKKAIEFYDKAIKKGLNNGNIHFKKGVSLRYLQKYNEALQEIEISLTLEPTNQEYMNEKGVIYYVQNKFDEALKIFEISKTLPNTDSDLYYWVARIYHKQEDINKALIAYYKSIEMMPKEGSYYAEALEYIGKIEYSFTKEYFKSAEAYNEAIKLNPENYSLYSKLMKAYNAAKEYPKADSIFQIVKKAFENGKLSKDDMEIKTVQIAEFEWNGQKATIIKSFIEPKDPIDISYKVFLLNKEGDAVIRRFVVEKAISFGDEKTKHLLCEQDKKTGGHITYLYGWSVDNIPLDDLERAVKLVLDGKMKPGASSNFGRKK